MPDVKMLGQCSRGGSAMKLEVIGTAAVQVSSQWQRGSRPVILVPSMTAGSIRW